MTPSRRTTWIVGTLTLAVLVGVVVAAWRPAMERWYAAKFADTGLPVEERQTAADRLAEIGSTLLDLPDMSTVWKKASACERAYESRDRATAKLQWTGTAVDLVFGSNSQLRAVADVYASDDAEKKSINDFVAAWTKVMNLDRFDLSPAPRGGPRTAELRAR